MSGKYILIKDIQQPNDYCIKAGTVFEKLGNGPDYAYSCGERNFHPSIVENNPEWFKKLDKPIINYTKMEYKEKLQRSQVRLIEVISNPMEPLAMYQNELLIAASNLYDVAKEQLKEGLINKPEWVKKLDEQIYTEEDMRKCWEYSLQSHFSAYLYADMPGFKDYIKTIKK